MVKQRQYETHPRATAAYASNMPLPNFDAWEARYRHFLPEHKTKRGRGRATGRTLTQILIFASARKLTERGVRAGDAIEWCAKVLPKHFEAILRGKRKVAVAEVRGPSGPVRLDLVAVVGEVRKRLDFGTVITDATQPTSDQLFAETQRVSEYMQSQEYRERLMAFRAEVAARGKPATWREAAEKLRIPIWIIELGRAEAQRQDATEQQSSLAELAAQLAPIVSQEADSARA
jgi:hypothetical protein